MRDIYFATYKLGSPSEKSPSLDEVIPVLEQWLFNPQRPVQRPEEYDPLADHQSFGRDGVFGEGVEFGTRFYGGDDTYAFALRYQHPDAKIRSKRWVTEVTAYQKGEDASRSTRASVRLRIGYEGKTLTPDVEAVSRPRLVKDLIRQFGGYESLPLSLEPRRLDPEEIDTFVNLLTHDARVFPVVWLSADNENENPVIDPKPIADWLAGVAHVIVSNGSRPSRMLNERLGKRYNCFNGAVRVYWPGFSRSDSPYDHDLWPPEEVRQIEERKAYGFRSHLLALISNAATNRLLDGIVRWEDVRRQQSIHQLRQRKSGDGVDQLLEEADGIIKGLEAEKRALEEERNQAQKEAERALNLSKSWRLAYQKVVRKEEEDDSIDPERPPATVSEAVDQVVSKYGPREEGFLQIPKRTRNKVTDEFADPESVHDALLWIATVFVRAKRGKVSCSDFDLSCRETSGFFYRSNQSDITMGKYSDDYYMEWNGEKRKLKRHLGRGSSKDPRRSLRIAFFYDEDLETAVVGFIGQHQKTDAT